MMMLYVCRKITKMISDDNDNMNDPGMVNDDDGMYQPQQPLTFEKVWLMFQETDKKFQETDRLLNEQSRESDKKFRETREDILKTRKEVRETTRSVKTLSKNLGGIGNNLGEVAEEYFFRALEKLPEVAGVKIAQVGKLNKKVKNLQREYDVVLFGHNTLIAVEVKHKLETKDVIAYCDKSLPVLKQLFPEYAGYKIIGAVAGMSATHAAVELAFEKGLLVFTQSGQKIRLLNPKGFEPKEF